MTMARDLHGGPAGRLLSYDGRKTDSSTVPVSLLIGSHDAHGCL